MNLKIKFALLPIILKNQKEINKKLNNLYEKV